MITTIAEGPSPQPSATHHVPVIHDVGRIPAHIIGAIEGNGPLEDPRLSAAVLLAAVAIALGWLRFAVRRRRRGAGPGRHPVLRRVGLSTALTALTVLGVALGVNSYAGYLPTFDAVGGIVEGGEAGTAGPYTVKPVAVGTPAHGAGRVVATRIAAPRLRIGALTAYVYLPPGYDAAENRARRYPVAYLIHGFAGRPADWLVAGQAERTMDALIGGGVVRPMILVFPDANGGWMHDSECLNAAHGPQDETYLTRTVVEHTDRAFRTAADRASRAIGGMSSGGYCALNLGMHHQDTFGVILALDPYLDPGREVIGPLLGGSEKQFRRNSPRDYLRTIAVRQPLSAFLAAGGADETTSHAARWAAAVLARRGQYVALRIQPDGEHTWRNARAELPYAVVFADGRFPGARLAGS
jgi:enterochelin esterase-like enzyme